MWCPPLANLVSSPVLSRSAYCFSPLSTCGGKAPWPLSRKPAPGSQVLENVTVFRCSVSIRTTTDWAPWVRCLLLGIPLNNAVYVGHLWRLWWSLLRQSAWARRSGNFRQGRWAPWATGTPQAVRRVWQREKERTQGSPWTALCVLLAIIHVRSGVENLGGNNVTNADFFYCSKSFYSCLLYFFN